jgi:hypothetical protein
LYVSSNFIIVADFNNDSNEDFASANTPDYTISVLLGNGDGTFPRVDKFLTNSPPFTITTNDFNNDKKLDIATSNVGGDDISVLLGQGDGSFPGFTTYPSGHSPIYIISADFNNDGQFDLVTSNFDETDSSISILLGNGNGTFQKPLIYTVWDGPWALTTGIFTDNNKLDLVITNYFSSSVTILFNVCP